MGLAIWHFTIFLPDRFWGGMSAHSSAPCSASILFGLIIYGR